MRIVYVDIWTVIVPVIPGRVNSPEFGMASWPKMSKQVLRLRTDDGLASILSNEHTRLALFPDRGIPAEERHKATRLLRRFGLPGCIRCEAA